MRSKERRFWVTVTLVGMLVALGNTEASLAGDGGLVGGQAVAFDGPAEERLAGTYVPGTQRGIQYHAGLML